MRNGRDTGKASAQQDRNEAPRRRFMVLAAVGYAVAATAWIVFSDRLLAGLGDVATVIWLASLKGFAFVVVTVPLLVLALRFVPPPLHARTAANRPWPLGVAFVVVAAAITVVTLLAYQVAVDALRR